MKITLLLALATAAIAGDIVNNDVSTTYYRIARTAY
jgi:hypothetical protein